MPYVAAEDGVRIYYEVAGEGRPVLLLPGAFQTLQDWHDSGVFDELARDRTVIAIDLRGHGRSDAPHAVAAYGWPKNARDAAAVLDEVDAQDADVYGFSMGGNVAMAMLHGDLSRIRSIAGSGVLLPPPDFPVPAPPLVERAAALRRGGVAGALAGEAMTDDRPPEWSLKRSLAGDAEAFAAEAEAQATLEDQSLPLAGPPTLFISAERDAMSVALSKDLPAANTYVRYVQIPDANHFIGIMPDVLPTLRDFWASLG